jgi:membrane peptidoglycan carboxypeptidase
MPIPQLEPKRSYSPEHARDASAIRKKRAAERTGGQFNDAGSSGFHSRAVGNGPTPRPASESGAISERKPKEKKPKKAHRLRRRILKWLLILAIVGVVLGIAGAAGAYFWVSKDLADLTDLEKRAIAQSTKIYARDGSTLLYEVGDNKRQDVNLDQIADQMEWATVALEDKHFYEHKGVSPISIARAAFANIVKGETTQGASTLTQQFIKNAVLTPERTYTRKVKEAILAMRLEQKYSKDEILNFYLNEVYYGANYQGVEASSQGFFGKPASDLSLAESATLAALAQNPVVLANDPERLKARRDYAIDQMVEQGYVDQAAADEAKAVELAIREEVTEIRAPHFVFYVRSYLEEKYGQNTVRKGGLKVTTTLDWDKQQKGEQAVVDGIPKVEQYGGSNAALVSLDTHTGQILAMVGSRDFFDESHDGQVNVVTSLRQPGSSFKPIVYLAAFEKGYTPDTRVFDLETDFPTDSGVYHPRNYNRSIFRP